MADMNRELDNRVPLSRRDWMLMIPVALFSWVVPYFIYRLTGSSDLSSAWSAGWIALALTLMTGFGWTYPYFANRGTPSELFGGALILVLAGLIAAGIELHAGSRSLFEVLLKGRPEHANWYWSPGFAWYAIFLSSGYVFLLSGVRRWLWLIVDRKRKI